MMMMMMMTTIEFCDYNKNGGEACTDTGAGLFSAVSCVCGVSCAPRGVRYVQYRLKKRCPRRLI